MISNFKLKISNSERGVSLVVTFLIMTIMLAMVLSISLMLYHEITIVSNIGNSVLALYAAESGAEKMLYFDRKHIPNGLTRGFCNICNTCDTTECLSCTATPLAINGCDVSTCNNCQITYTTNLDGKTYQADGAVFPSTGNPSISIFNINIKGSYQGTARSVQVTSSQ